MLHDGACQLDGIPDLGHAADRAGLQAAAIHDGRIQFVVPVEGEHRSAAGVEQGVVFEDHHRAHHGIQAGAAGLQYAIADVERLFETGTIFPLQLCANFSARQSTRAPVNC